MKPEHKILFTSVPKLNELKYFVGVIDFREKLTVLSNFTWQKMVTRRLIETHREILAAPFERKLSYVHIIFPGNFTTGEMKNFTNKTNLTLCGQVLLSKDTYLECILFSLSVRLSPEWNRMEKYFVKGDFLNAFEAVEAIRFQLLLTDGCLAFSTSALRLKLLSANLIDLDVDFQGLSKEGFAKVQKKVFVLPNLKQGTAVCLYSKLPPSCPLLSYDQIKTHWRKLYGYNLPPNEESMTYVEVIFNNSFSYLYPIICVCPYEPIHFWSKDELTLIEEFSTILTNKFSKICRHPIGIGIKDAGVFRPVSKLHLASEVVDKANLSLLVSDGEVLQEFQNENAPKCCLTTPSKKQKRGRSPPLFLPSFGQIAPKPADETFKCFPIFTPKVKAQFASGNPFKKPKSSHVQLFDLFDQVKASVAGKNLHQMSLQTLLRFCSSNGIPTKKREKKATVLEKIYNYFH